MTTFKNRVSNYPIQHFFLSRVSSRAFSKEPILEEELMALFEAARWAPSSFDNQPWRFIFARKGDKYWNTLFNALVPFNQSWCKDADTLILVITRKNFDHNNKPARTAPFDSGAAWMSLALEAHLRGIVAHGMEGFDYDGIRKSLNISDNYNIEAMIALGKLGDPETLPDALKSKETPSDRKPLTDIISNGVFNFT